MESIKGLPLNALTYSGKISGFYKVWFKNFILRVVTIGLYSFWAKVSHRKYIVSNFSLLGDNFVYNGTAKEGITGFFKVLPFYGFALYASYYSDINGDNLGYVLASILFTAIIYHSVFNGIKYKLSRITWRGIRGKMIGSPLTYVGIKLKKVIFGTITLGYLIPKYDIEAYEYKFNRTYYGSLKLRFEGNYKDFTKINIITLLLFLPTLGMSRIWYKARLMRYVYNYTKVGDLRFENDITGNKLFVLYIKTIMITLFTLGLGIPIAYHMFYNFIANNFAIRGDINTSKILQTKREVDASGDMLEDMAEDDGGLF